uniref:Uncharacterized protein n=1 Tax=Rhizophora mucronata TaxID=61149 RepID=A0A2P2LV73_RHIMU
MSIRQFMF